MVERDKKSGSPRLPPQDSKSADAGGGGSAQPQDRPATQGSDASKRRSQRVSIAVAILVYGRGKDGEPFQEETRSLVVNAHGGLILLAASVEKEQKLLLMNPKTMEEVQGRVAYQGRTNEDKTEIGIEFSEPAPRFRHIVFPPEDWDRSERKLPPSARG
ncbi:MAG: hypothetical protein ACRD50_05445 [Candidatus Acidiferrales bacterium]